MRELPTKQETPLNWIDLYTSLSCQLGEIFSDCFGLLLLVVRVVQSENPHGDHKRLSDTTQSAETLDLQVLDSRKIG